MPITKHKKSASTGKKNIIVYRTETCPWCHKVMDWLKAHKLPFKDYDVGKDQKALQEMVKKSNQMGVPVTDINGTIVIGFNESKLKQLLL